MKGKEEGSGYLTAEILRDILKDYPDGVRDEKLYLELARRNFLVWNANLCDVLRPFLIDLITYDRNTKIVKLVSENEKRSSWDIAKAFLIKNSGAVSAMALYRHLVSNNCVGFGVEIEDYIKIWSNSGLITYNREADIIKIISA